jgi:hypothetical protein
MRQLSFFKEKLGEDKTRYGDHFKVQKESFESSDKLVCEQFNLLRKMIEVKYTEVKAKLAQYWSHC